MPYKFLVQYPENNPGDFVDDGFTDLDDSINRFNNIDWELQFSKISKRLERNLTSSSPGIMIRNMEKDESLSIYVNDDGSIYIEYHLGNSFFTEMVNCDITKNPEDIEAVDYIIAFFKNELAIDLTENENNNEKYIELGHYNPGKFISLNKWLLLMLPLGLIFLIFIPAFKIGILLLFIGSLYGAILIFNIPFFVVMVQYLLKPVVQSVVIDTENNSLTIKYKDQQISVFKQDIIQSVLTFNSNTNSLYSSLNNLVITSRNKRQHYLTSLSFSKVELSRIIDLIKVNHYKCDVVFPFIKATVFSDYYTNNFAGYTDRAQLKELYENYTDNMLQEIINNKSDYQPEAVEVAINEIDKRKRYS